MGLHFYIGGTSGARDGTHISEGDLSNPLIFDGMYPAAGVTLSKSITVYLRADLGETWHWVQIQIRGANASNFSMTSSVGANDGANSFINVVLLSTVTDTNMGITVTGSCSGSDSASPDTSCKLIAWGWKA